uniref:Uncharacterized protein n=1 Tax=Romanomermis culicivorax TaxID=13658 RepID=A0A915HRP5_ROMCU
MDDQQRKHLHRNGAPKKDEKNFLMKRSAGISGPLVGAPGGLTALAWQIFCFISLEPGAGLGGRVPWDAIAACRQALAFNLAWSLGQESLTILSNIPPLPFASPKRIGGGPPSP